MIEFIARNLAWLGLRLLSPEAFAVPGGLQEVFVILPVEAPIGNFVYTLRNSQLGQKKIRISRIIALYPGRTRNSKGFSDERDFSASSLHGNNFTGQHRGTYGADSSLLQYIAI